MSESTAIPLAPLAGVDIAVTQRCVPPIGHRCWQYHPNAKALPVWVATWTNRHGNGRIEFCDQHGSTDIYFEPGDWLVEYLEEPGGAAYVFSPAEFAEKFRIVQP